MFLSFEPLLKIKRSGALEGSNQAIKADIHRSRSLIPVTNSSAGDI